MSITMSLLLGAVCGVGVFACVVAVWRPVTPLGQRLAALETTPHHPATTAPVGTQPRWMAATRPLTGWLRKIGAPGESAAADVAVTGSHVDDLLARQAIGVAAGGLAAAVAIVTASFAGTPFTGVAALVIAVAAPSAGYLVPRAQLHRKADQLRTAHRDGLSGFLDLVAVACSAGASIETAIDAAARTGTGPAFDTMRHLQATCAMTRTSLAEAVDGFGDSTGVIEYQQLGATLGLIGDEGAKVAASLSARADSLRTSRAADDRAHTESQSERLNLPVAACGVAFLLIIGYPALHAAITSF